MLNRRTILYFVVVASLVLSVIGAGYAGGVRRTAVLVLLALFLAGCGGGGGKKEPKAGTLASVLDRPGPDVALVQGTSDYAVGEMRVTFLVVDREARLISRPRAQVLVGTSLASEPLVRTVARLEPIGIPGRSEAALGGARSIYVARFRLAKPGKYTLVAAPEGAAIQGVANLQVATKPTAPAVGARAIPSRTPTLASTNGDVAALTTASPPDLSLLRYSVADSIRAHVPFVLVFATPKYCTSRTCGPVVDVVSVRTLVMTYRQSSRPIEMNALRRLFSVMVKWIGNGSGADHCQRIGLPVRS